MVLPSKEDSKPTERNDPAGVNVMVSVGVSQRLGRTPFWIEHRVEFRPIRTDTSEGNPILVLRYGNAHIGLAYTSHIRRRTHRLNADRVLALPNHPLQPGDSAGRKSSTRQQ